MQSIKVIKT